MAPRSRTGRRPVVLQERQVAAAARSSKADRGVATGASPARSRTSTLMVFTLREGSGQRVLKDRGSDGGRVLGPPQVGAEGALGDEFLDVRDALEARALEVVEGDVGGADRAV